MTVSQVTSPQMTGTWSSGTGVSSEPVTGSGSAAGSGTGSQSTGSTSSSSQPVQREDQLDSSTQDVTSGKRKPKWLRDTLREAETVGQPKEVVREVRRLENFCSYSAIVSSEADQEPSTF